MGFESVWSDRTHFKIVFYKSIIDLTIDDENDQLQTGIQWVFLEIFCGVAFNLPKNSINFLE